MYEFWLLAFTLVLIVGFALFWPMLRQTAQSAAPDREAHNIGIARERLAELQQARDAGELDDAQFASAKAELEQRLAEDLEASVATENGRAMNVWASLGAILVVPLAGGILYWQTGTPELIDNRSYNAAPTRAMIENQAEMQRAQNRPEDQRKQFDELLVNFAKKMEEQPDNLDGWIMLGRSYSVAGQYDNALAAYQRADKLEPKNPDILTAIADVTAMTQQGDIEGRPREILEQVIELDPTATTALYLLGLAAADRNEHAVSADYWKQLLGQIDDQEQRQPLIELIIEQEKLAGLEPTVELAQPLDALMPGIQVTVTLAPELAAKAGPNETVFIFAKAVKGPQMPLAAVRASVADLPMSVTLSDAQAMMPQMRLSMFDQVTVGARVSRSGQPTGGVGDFFAEVSPVDVAATPQLDLVIDQIRTE